MQNKLITAKQNILILIIIIATILRQLQEEFGIKAILDYLKEHPTAIRQEVAEALGNITEDGIKYHFSRLQSMGYLKREGGRKLGHWVATI